MGLAEALHRRRNAGLNRQWDDVLRGDLPLCNALKAIRTCIGFFAHQHSGFRINGPHCAYAGLVVGWSMKPTLAREVVLNALAMAMWHRNPNHKVLIHSDQGSQFSSDDLLRPFRHHNLEPSMSRRGNCWDNAVAESFFSSLKKERIKKRIYKNCELARADIFDYIEVFYNRQRRHSHLGGVSPEAFAGASF